MNWLTDANGFDTEIFRVELNVREIKIQLEIQIREMTEGDYDRDRVGNER